MDSMELTLLVGTVPNKKLLTFGYLYYYLRPMGRGFCLHKFCDPNSSGVTGDVGKDSYQIITITQNRKVLYESNSPKLKAAGHA